MSEIPTRERIIDAAERLYSKNGFAGTSLRTIIRAAGVNTAAVHYHFGSREGLIEAVISRRASPINQERLRRLDAIEASEGPIPLEDVIESFVAPVIRMIMDPAHKGRRFPRLMVWAGMEPDPKLRVIIRRVFAEVFERYVQALDRALPGLSRADIYWRMHFLLGSMAFTIAVPVGLAAEDSPSPNDANPVIERLVAFTAAGMRGHSVATPGERT